MTDVPERPLEVERTALATSADETGHRLIRVAAIAAVAVIVVLSVVPGDLRPSIGASGNVEHALAYAGAAFFAGLAWRHARAIYGPFAFSILAGFAEIAQIFVPGRHAGLDNWAASTCGAVLGITAAATLLAHRRRRSGRA